MFFNILPKGELMNVSKSSKYTLQECSSCEQETFDPLSTKTQQELEQKLWEKLIFEYSSTERIVRVICDGRECIIITPESEGVFFIDTGTLSSVMVCDLLKHSEGKVLRMAKQIADAFRHVHEKKKL